MFFSVLLVCLLSYSRAEIFTALADMEPLLYAEQELATHMKEYIAEEEQRLQKLKEYVNFNCFSETLANVNFNPTTKYFS